MVRPIKSSSSQLNSVYGARVEYEKVQKRRAADAKCRANIAECFNQLKSNIHFDAKLSKSCILQESLRKIHYLEAIVSLQLMNVQGGEWSPPAWKQVTIQSIHQEFIDSYKNGIVIKKKPKKTKKVYKSKTNKKPSKLKSGKSNSVKVRVSMNADQVVPCSPAVNYQHVCKPTKQFERIQSSVASSSVSKIGSCRNACLTPDLMCNEDINEADHENAMDMFRTPKQYRLILPNNAPRKPKHSQLENLVQRQNRKKRKLEFGQTDEHVAALFRNKKRKTDMKRLMKQSCSARTRPISYYYDKQRKYQDTPPNTDFPLGSCLAFFETERSCHGLRDHRKITMSPSMDNQNELISDENLEDVDVIGDHENDIDVRMTRDLNESACEEFGETFLQEQSNTDDDNGILLMILEMENEFSNQGCIDAFMGNKDYDDDSPDNYGIVTSSLGSSTTEESSSLPSPVGFTDVAMDSDFFDTVKNSSFQMDMLLKSNPEVVNVARSPSETSIFCFENDDDLSGGDLTCYEDDLPISSFSFYSPQKKSFADMPFEISDECITNGMTDSKESLHWCTSMDSVYQQTHNRKVNIPSVDDSAPASSAHYQVVPELVDDYCSVLPYMATESLAGSSANYPPPRPHKMKWFLQDPEILACYEGIDDM
ncbi:uncharacterized protein LOC117108282 isoform X2 [Anneissia japonica]|uniref:uncharacterized protein LOC117108282 isoform X2 n=1 Tax=Anneissia japonica TaxID=1529436 RepID=UPI0014258B0C|nr:uncharacterized protein LOC117108282 isoform X2 [Anneissia japonica]